MRSTTFFFNFLFERFVQTHTQNRLREKYVRPRIGGKITMFE